MRSTRRERSCRRSRRDRCIIVGASRRLAGIATMPSFVARRATNRRAAWTSRDDDIYNIIYSSGTTGSRRGSSTRTTSARSTARCSRAQFRFTPESVVMHAGSLVFNGAFVTLMPAWFLGCTYVLQEQFDAAEFIETVAARERDARDDGAVADRRRDQRAELLGREAGVAARCCAPSARRGIASTRRSCCRCCRNLLRAVRA